MDIPKKKLAITLVATNAYIALGIRFIKKFIYHYKGDRQLIFCIYTDHDPYQYLSEYESSLVEYIHTEHKSWVVGANSKFRNILFFSKRTEADHVFFFDADTDIVKDFNENWFIGDMVVGEHFGNRTYMKSFKYFDQNPRSSCYVNPFSNLKREYYYGAFFGGTKRNMIKFCSTMVEWQEHNKKIKYEPPVNDESYLNAYFHYNKATRVVRTPDFDFIISDKGSIENTRNASLDIENLKKDMIIHKNKVYDIKNSTIKIKK